MTPVTPSSVCDMQGESDYLALAILAYEAHENCVVDSMKGPSWKGLTITQHLQWMNAAEAICAALAERTQQEAQPTLHPLDALLPDICNLIDTIKMEWSQQGSWSEWDQSVRDRISAYHIAQRTAQLQPNDEAAPNEARLHRAARTIAVQAGEEPQKFIDWLCDGGLVQMALSHFGPTKVEASEPEKGKGPQPFGCGPSGNQLASEKIGGVGTDKSYTQTSAPPPPSSSDALTEFHRWRLLRVVENTQGNRRLWVAGFKAGRGQA